PARALAPLSARLLHTDTALAPTVPARLEPSAGGAHPRYRRRLAPLARRADAHERDPGAAGAALVGGRLSGADSVSSAREPYEQVRDELDVWGDRVAAGGVVLFHDTDSFPDIRRAIDEWCSSRGVPYRYLGGSNGLGIAYPGRGRVHAALLGSGNGLRVVRE